MSARNSKSIFGPPAVVAVRGEGSVVRRGLVVSAIDVVTFLTTISGHTYPLKFLEWRVSDDEWDMAYDPWERLGGRDIDLTWIAALGIHDRDILVLVVVVAQHCPHRVLLNRVCPICQREKDAWWYHRPVKEVTQIFV